MFYLHRAKATALVCCALLTSGIAAAGDVIFEERVLVLSEDQSELRNLLALDVDGDGNVDFVTQVRFELPGRTVDRIAWYENGGQSVPSFSSGPVATFVDCPDRQVTTFAANLAGFSQGTEIATHHRDCPLSQNPGSGPSEFYFFPGFGVSQFSIDADAQRAVAADLVSCAQSTFPEELLYLADVGSPDSESIRLALGVGSPIAVVSGRNFGGFFPADIDGDGFQDALVSSLVVGGGTVNRLSWFKVGGADPCAPTFQENVIQMDFGPELTGLRLRISAGDVNGDTHTDVLVATTDVLGTGGVTWFENDGASPPGFTEHPIDAQRVFYGRIASGDVDGDGDLDVIVGELQSPGATIYWYENLVQDGSLWSARREVGVVDLNGGDDFQVRDMDGDGDPDVLARWHPGFPDTTGGEIHLFVNLPEPRNVVLQIVAFAMVLSLYATRRPSRGGGR